MYNSVAENSMVIWEHSNVPVHKAMVLSIMKRKHNHKMRRINYTGHVHLSKGTCHPVQQYVCLYNSSVWWHGQYIVPLGSCQIGSSLVVLIYLWFLDNIKKMTQAASFKHWNSGMQSNTGNITETQWVTSSQLLTGPVCPSPCEGAVAGSVLPAVTDTEFDTADWGQ